MSKLQQGTIVHLKGGKTAKVLKLLGEGGQGYVYLAELDGEQMALKWYKASPSKNPDVFYKNLLANATNGAPSPVFIWPKYVTEKENDSFGYIMDLRPEGYYEFGQYLLAKQKFHSFFARTTAAMDICEGFKALHARGLSYQDLNDGNFFINPSSGHVMICDNDNAFPNGQESGIIGKMRYMAPEIVLDKKRPDAYSDKFSLALILFELFYMNHPFEGEKSLNIPCMTETHEKKLYGSEIVFICDATDKSNQPIRGYHNNVIRHWPILPKILRDTFQAEFGKDKLQNPTKRITEQQWLDILTIVRDSLICCPYCNEETFIQLGSTYKCMNCGKQFTVEHEFTDGKRHFPLTRGNNIYLDRDDKPDMRIVQSPNDARADVIQNLTPNAWMVQTPSGKIVKVEPRGIMPVKTGLVVNVTIKGTMHKLTIK